MLQQQGGWCGRVFELRVCSDSLSIILKMLRTSLSVLSASVPTASTASRQANTGTAGSTNNDFRILGKSTLRTSAGNREERGRENPSYPNSARERESPSECRARERREDRQVGLWSKKRTPGPAKIKRIVCYSRNNCNCAYLQSVFFANQNVIVWERQQWCSTCQLRGTVSLGKDARQRTDRLVELSHNLTVSTSLAFTNCINMA